MQEGSLRSAYGAKMVAQGIFMLTAPLTLIITPLAALTHKLTGFDAWKSFTEAFGYREVNQENPLKRSSFEEVSLLDDDSPQNSQQSVQIIKGNNNTIISQPKDTPEPNSGKAKEVINNFNKNLNTKTSSNSNDKDFEKKEETADKHISATSAILAKKAPSSFAERNVAEEAADKSNVINV